jgi:hypothetical protein
MGMDNVRIGILAAFGVGLAAVSAWMHIKDKDGSGWGLAAAAIWLSVLISA